MAHDEFFEIEQLYKLFCYQKKHEKKNLLNDLNCTIGQLLNWIQQLTSMGLEFHIDNNTICLLTDSEPLDSHSVQQQVLQQGITKNLNFYFTTTSTNFIAQQCNNPSYFITEHQSSARGRGAKKWVSPLGQCIALSLSHRFNVGLTQLSGLNIAIGVAIITALKKHNETAFGLKWPNDILGEKGKLAGILIEVSGNNKQCTAVIGIGINWNLSEYNLSLIDQECTNIINKNSCRSLFLITLIVEIEKTLKEFSQNQLKNIQEIWKLNDFLLGQKIKIQQQQNSYKAHYQGIDSSGCLVVKKNNELIKLASGEVSIIIN